MVFQEKKAPMVQRRRILEGIASAFVTSEKKRTRMKKECFQAYLNKQRFPSEVWFLEKLKAANLGGFECNMPVGIYFIDFAFQEQMIAVEIDGKSHDTPEQKFKDKIKNKYLLGVGWTVIRIKAYNEVKAKEAISLISAYPNSIRAGLPANQKKKEKKTEQKRKLTLYVAEMSPEQKKAYRKAKREARKKGKKVDINAFRAHALALRAPERFDPSENCYANKNPILEESVVKKSKEKKKRKNRYKEASVEPVIVYKKSYKVKLLRHSKTEG
jgi:very-short-patch-repair endonuclease